MEFSKIPLSCGKANEFVNQYHRHNKKTARNGGRFAIGCQHADLGLIGVAIVGNPLSASYMDGFTAEVLRTCTRPDAPKNVNSFLYGACWRIWKAMGGRRLITYTLQSESGASLRGAGWRIVGEAKIHKEGWGKKDGIRRSLQHVQTLEKYRWEVSIMEES